MPPLRITRLLALLALPPTLACLEQRPNPNHCYLANGNATCDELLGAELDWYCSSPADECAPAAPLGCVSSRPSEDCYSPCGAQELIADGPLSCDPMDPVAGDGDPACAGISECENVTDEFTITAGVPDPWPAPPPLGVPQDCELCDQLLPYVYCGDIFVDNFQPPSNQINYNWSICGLAGADTLAGGADHDYIDGGSASDTLLGNGGDDIIIGEVGNDALFGGNHDDWMLGGDGEDTLHGGAGNDALDGGAGHDALFGGSGNNTLVGGSGNNTLAGGPGDDFLVGGFSHDIYIWRLGDGHDTIINESLSPNTIWFGGVAPDELTLLRLGADLKIVAPGGSILVADHYTNNPDLQIQTQ